VVLDKISKLLWSSVPEVFPIKKKASTAITGDTSKHSLKCIHFNHITS